VLGEIGHRLGRKVLVDVATVARPDTILGWYRKLVARKFDNSKARRGPVMPAQFFDCTACSWADMTQCELWTGTYETR
jgi:hypothetical protein